MCASGRSWAAHRSTEAEQIQRRRRCETREPTLLLGCGGCISYPLAAIAYSENPAVAAVAEEGPSMTNHLPIHVSGDVHGHTAHFHIFIDFPGLADKARSLFPFLRRIPPQHAPVFDSYPIFFIENKPDSSVGGGTWRRDEVGVFRGIESITGVSDAQLQALVIDPGKGLIGIPRNRWVREVPRLKFTVLHEVGHAVDYSPGMSLAPTTPPGTAVADWDGVTPACRARDPVKQRAVEAYARFVLGHPRICRDLTPDGEDACNRRIIAHLRRSPAFQWVPSTWRPTGP